MRMMVVPFSNPKGRGAVLRETSENLENAAGSIQVKAHVADEIPCAA